MEELEGISSKRYKEPVLSVYETSIDSRRIGQKGCLGKGYCAFDKRQIPEHEVQYEQQNQEHLPKYEIFIRICKHILHVLTPFVLMIYAFTDENTVVEPDPLSEGFARYANSNMEQYVFEFLLNYVRRMKSDMDWRKLLKKNPE